MKKVDQSALLPYPAEFMFNLVNNVADYSDFLPWCETSEVLSQTEDEVVARLTMAGAGLRQGFTARNRLTPPHQIDLTVVEGPFKEFAGSWQFTQLGEGGCKVELQLQFEVDSLLFKAALSQVLEMATDRLVDAFCDRAEQLYSVRIT